MIRDEYAFGSAAAASTVIGPYHVDQQGDMPKTVFQCICKNEGDNDVVITPQESEDGTTYSTAGGDGAVTIKAHAEETFKFYLGAGEYWRIRAAGDCHCRLQIIELDPSHANTGQG